MGLGVDSSPVVPTEKQPPPKSVGHSTTLEKDLATKTEISVHLRRLSEMVGRRLRKHLLTGRTITLTIRYSNFHTFTRQITLEKPINHSPTIYSAAQQILNSISLKSPIRLLGVSISNLSPHSGQLSLFENHCKTKISKVMDDINDRYGEFTLTWSTTLSSLQSAGIISPGWRPER